MAHGSWRVVSGSCLMVHGSSLMARPPRPKSHRAHLLSWPWAINLEPWASSHEPWILANDNRWMHQLITHALFLKQRQLGAAVSSGGFVLRRISFSDKHRSLSFSGKNSNFPIHSIRKTQNMILPQNNHRIFICEKNVIQKEYLYIWVHFPRGGNADFADPELINLLWAAFFGKK